MLEIAKRLKTPEQLGEDLVKANENELKQAVAEVWARLYPNVWTSKAEVEMNGMFANIAARFTKAKAAIPQIVAFLRVFHFSKNLVG